MKIHPDALRQILRAMEKDLQKKEPGAPAKERKYSNETIQVYHKDHEISARRNDRDCRRIADGGDVFRRSVSGAGQTLSDGGCRG